MTTILYDASIDKLDNNSILNIILYLTEQHRRPNIINYLKKEKQYLIKDCAQKYEKLCISDFTLSSTKISHIPEWIPRFILYCNKIKTEYHTGCGQDFVLNPRLDICECIYIKFKKGITIDFLDIYTDSKNYFAIPINPNWIQNGIFRFFCIFIPIFHFTPIIISNNYEAIEWIKVQGIYVPTDIRNQLYKKYKNRELLDTFSDTRALL